MENKNPTEKKVSIILVSYNAEKYIEKTLNSCLNQTYGEIEVLLLDNASKDSTLEIAQKIQKKDIRLKIFKSLKNLGPYGGLNFLLEKVEGEYVAVQDHDDIWFPEKIEKQVEFLKNNLNFIACGTNTFYYYETKEVLVLNKKSEVCDFVDHTSLIFRNHNFRYDENYLLADEYFEKKILAEKGKIGCLQEVLTVHRIKGDGTNLSTSRFKFSWKNMQEFFEINKLKMSSFLYLIDLMVTKHLSDGIIWFVRKKITQKNTQWLSLVEFKNSKPQIEL